MEKFKRISFALATLFIVGALGVKLGKPEWQAYANYAVIAGVFFFLVSLYFERGELKNFFTARSTKYGMNSFVMVLFVLAILGIANWIVNRHPMKYDTTKNKSFSLSPLTVSTLQNLKQPVKITAFYTESQEEGLRQQMKDLLENYRVQSPKLEVKIVDPLKSFQMVKQYNIERNGTTVFESGTQKTTISTTGEEDVTNAILRVTSNKSVTVYFLEGHQESSITNAENGGLSSILDELKKANYKVEEYKDLAVKSKIPDDCSALIIASPRAALLDHEIKALKDYLAAGGRVLILDDPQSDPSLSKILTDYKITAGDDTVVDDQYFFPPAGVAVPQIVAKQGTPLTKDFGVQMFFPVARSLSYPQGEAQGSRETFTSFAESTEFGWAETDKEKAEFNAGQDRKGPITVGLAVNQPVETKEKRSPEMRMVVFGDADFVGNGFVGIPGNRQIFLNAMAWLTEQENLIHLPPRDNKTDVMVLSSTQLNYLALLLVVAMPGAIIATGIAVWVRRKKL